MSDKTSIQWTDATWNPIRGCSRVSPGCEHCYAEGVAARFSGPGLAFEGLARRTARGLPQWTGKVRMVPEKLADPLGWKRPRRIFVNSVSDLFHDGLTSEQIAAIFGVMAAAPRHTFQVLTKRPERMRRWFDWIASGEHHPSLECASLALAAEAAHVGDLAGPIHCKHGPPSRCWPWRGHGGRPAKNCVFRGKAAHRVAYRLALGALHPDDVVARTCGDARCCNPDHLAAATKRAVAVASAVKPRAKLSQAQVDEIRRRHAAGESGAHLSRAFGLAHSQISRILHGQQWR